MNLVQNHLILPKPDPEFKKLPEMIGSPSNVDLRGQAFASLAKVNVDAISAFRLNHPVHCLIYLSVLLSGEFRR